MKELTVEDFYNLVVEILETILKEVVGENPNGDSIFPCIVVQAPIKYDEKIIDGKPILLRFSIICEAWTKKKVTSIALADKIDSKLRGYNFIRSGTPIDLYDEITKCHRYGGNYEVFYNALTNSLELVK